MFNLFGDTKKEIEILNKEIEEQNSMLEKKVDRENMKIRSAGKVAFLATKGITDIGTEKYEDDGKEKYLFIYKVTDEFLEAIEEYKNNVFLRDYNMAWGNVKFRIAQLKKRSR